MADKKTDVWMPLWIGAYLADTMSLTTVQHGAYFLLLIAYWRERKALPDDDDQLRSITKLERPDWKKQRPVLAKFFKIGDGVWWHKRVEQEISAADARSKKATEKAEKAAKARWGAGDKQPTSDAPSIPEALPEHVLDECPTPSPIPNPSDSSEAKASAAGAAEGQGKAVEKSPEEMAKAELWRAGKSLLIEADVPKDQCGTFLGALVAQYGALLVVDAVRSAVKEIPADPREYLKATCMRLKGERGADHGKPVTVASNAVAQTAAYIASQAMTDAEKEAARVAAEEFRRKTRPAVVSAGAQA